MNFFGNNLQRTGDSEKFHHEKCEGIQLFSLRQQCHDLMCLHLNAELIMFENDMKSGSISAYLPTAAFNYFFKLP